MIDDRDFDLLKEAVSELARLRDAVSGPARFLARLYASALEEWAGRLGMDPLQLNRLRRKSGAGARKEQVFMMCSGSEQIEMLRG